MKKLLFLCLIPLVIQARAQTTTAQAITKAIDSLVGKMDSVVIRTALCPTAAYQTIDTLYLQANSYGKFNLTFVWYDTVQHFVAFVQRVVSVWRIGTGQALYYIWPDFNVYPETTGLSVHQCNFSITYGGGQVIVNVDGFGAANPIRWHLFREQRITPL